MDVAKVLVALLCVGVAACDEGEDEGYPEECEFEETSLAPGDGSPSGFSAQDLLGNILGSTTTPMSWSPADGPAYYAMPGDTEISVEVGYSGGAVRYVEATPVGWCDGACADYCVSHLAIDVMLTLSTADGVLDETFATALTATSPDEAEFYVTFDPDETVGSMSWDSFVIDESGIEFEPGGSVIASGTVGPQSAGSLGLELPLSGEGGGWYAAFIAEWPSP